MQSGAASTPARRCCAQPERAEFFACLLDYLIRSGASAALQQPRLDGCGVYASGYPCPMCLAAMVSSGITQVYYAFGNAESARYGMSSEAAYATLGLPLVPTPVPMIRLDIGVTAAQMYGDAALPTGS